MPDQLAIDARAFLSNRLGDAFAKKATDRFCVNYYRKFQTTGNDNVVTIEAEARMMPNAVNAPSNIILEFDSSEDQFVQPEAGRDLTAFDLSEIESMISGNKNAMRFLKKAQKSSKISSKKEKSIGKVQHINSFLEKKIGESFMRLPKSIEEQPFITQYCWLNSTMKTLPNAESLTEAISDNLITQIDIPRKILKEIDSTRSAIFASQYSQRFNRAGRGVSIAIIDSEIFAEHPALMGRVFKMENYTTEPWGSPDFHATAIAGIIGSNNPQFMGIASEAKLYNYKVLGTNVQVSADDFAGAKAIEKALEDGIQIANCSWGISFVEDSISREAKACNEAWDLGLVIVKSAGNNGSGKGTLTTPAEADGVIVVGATGRNLAKVENYSSRGPIPSGQLRPHLVAPGGTDDDNMHSCLTTGGFGACGRGTSYAAPHVTGLLALIIEEDPTISNDDLRNRAIQLCGLMQGFNADDQGNGLISLSSLVP